MVRYITSSVRFCENIMSLVIFLAVLLKPTLFHHGRRSNLQDAAGYNKQMLGKDGTAGSVRLLYLVYLKFRYV